MIVTGEEEARVNNFNLRPATKWTVRKIVYEDKDTVPNENPDYRVPFVVLEKSAQNRLNDLFKNKGPLPTELTHDAWDAMSTPDTVTVTQPNNQNEDDELDRQEIDNLADNVEDQPNHGSTT
jgi:hypothetical protein